ncbi:transferrin receptor-like dimerization domain-containing protein [Hymenobacter sp. BT770]|uniref:transferrin receptor-like dimerization domain-containing protein n=1 Tax=Hymenobacter sp. BT770 TaxID=2886942 RepID=UPI001D109008|nr:transferrin receptor-like dimerization domain-containing protein [Hymenobacter sp. BT770]MCC3153472.1 M28 family peptidase [Hymenobacter sp. BT770]MDO3415446.1 transferrin receptor-like dimerization domain-containing protein [Hymenobacter sp. BT770]
MMLKRYALLLAGGLLASIPASAQTAPAEPKPLLGFDAGTAATEYQLETKFDAQLKADKLRDWMKRLAAHPHHVGSPYDKDNAEFMAGLFKSWGYDTRIDVSYVLFPTPKLRALELVAPTPYKALLTEKPLTEDATSGQTGEQLPIYNAFSKDGDVTAELVFVNYGVPKDYDELERRGISVKGKIVIAKYGGSWRGIKPKVAAEKGAIGCLIYSDPKDDGYGQGDVYPKGAFKPETGAQRGSVLDMPTYPGDPLTPGYGSTKNAKRLDYKKAPTLTQIPVLPISYGDAQPLLAALAGPMAPDAWRGALPIPYHLGPGPAKVHLQLAFNWKTEPVYNVIATLKGSQYPDQWVMRGNHHDAWVNGASDPLSGMVAELAEAQAVSELYKTGWRPKRTLMYCAWDGEEPGLLGSTEWAETNAKQLQKNVVAYLNTDNSERGFLYAAGSHTLEKFFNQVGRDVMDPEKNMSINERRRALDLVSGSPEAQKDARDRADLRIAALGAGSDYSPYIQHLGIPSMNVGFGGEGEGGEYHSIYDSFDHFTRFKDPNFAYGIVLAQTMGRAALRLANADVLPFEFQNFSNTVAKYGTEVKQLADNMRTETDKQAKLLAEKRYEAVADPTETLLPPKAHEAVPYLNFAPLDNALVKLEQSAQAYAQARKANTTLSNDRKKELDQLLYQAEQQLLSAEGLPRRPWYRHQIYAPGFYTGYGVKTLPGIREAVEERKWAEADEQIKRTAAAVERFSAQVNRAAAVASPPPAQ